MFPTSINGRIELSTLKPQHVETVMNAIRQQLRAEKAKDLRREGTAVVFRGGFFPFRFVSDFNVLGPVDSGRIEVHPGSPGEVRYRFSTVFFLKYVLIMALIGGLLFAIRIGVLEGMFVFLVAAGYLFGMNYLIAAIRLPAFVRRSATARGEGPAACPHCGALYDPSDYLDEAPEKRCSSCDGLLKL